MGPIKYNLSLTNTSICSKDYSMKKFIDKSKLFPMEYFDNYFASIIPMPPRLIHDRLNINGSQMKMSESFTAGDTKLPILSAPVHG